MKTPYLSLSQRLEESLALHNNTPSAHLPLVADGSRHQTPNEASASIKQVHVPEKGAAERFNSFLEARHHRVL